MACSSWVASSTTDLKSANFWKYLHCLQITFQTAISMSLDQTSTEDYRCLLSDDVMAFQCTKYTFCLSCTRFLAVASISTSASVTVLISLSSFRTFMILVLGFILPLYMYVLFRLLLFTPFILCFIQWLLGLAMFPILAMHATCSLSLLHCHLLLSQDRQLQQFPVETLHGHCFMDAEPSSWSCHPSTEHFTCLLNGFKSPSLKQADLQHAALTLQTKYRSFALPTISTASQGILVTSVLVPSMRGIFTLMLLPMEDTDIPLLGIVLHCQCTLQIYTISFRIVFCFSVVASIGPFSRMTANTVFMSTQICMQC